MISTLQDRVKESMQAKSLTNAQLALACKVKQPTSHNWASGKTKSIKGEPLLLAATVFGVTPQWLATGKGPKFPPDAGSNGHAVREPDGQYCIHDPWTTEAIQILSKLTDANKGAAVARLREFVNNLGPPRDGQALSMAA